MMMQGVKYFNIMYICVNYLFAMYLQYTLSLVLLISIYQPFVNDHIYSDIYNKYE